MSRILVTGAGGFIGGHLVGRLLREGHEVRAVDIKQAHTWYQFHPNADNVEADLRYDSSCHWVLASGDRFDEVYNLAADMGGMGFIENNKLACMLSSHISLNMLREAHTVGVKRFFYSSSACIYPGYRQRVADVTALKESSAYPADPEDGYGWEKLFSERMGRHYDEETDMTVRIARYHNVYGPYGTYDGGREKAPAAICRKVIQAKLSGDYTIDIWGDGEQTRSFMYIDDCIEGTRKIMDSDISYPINLGSSELVSINQLVSIVESIAGVTLQRHYVLDAPRGVRGRNSDNTLIQKELSWEPNISLLNGLEKTYAWIWNEMTNGTTKGSRFLG